MTANLRDRAAASNGGQVATRDDAPPTLAALITRLTPEIQRALPKHLNADRMARIATTVLRQNPELGECTPESFLGALLTASQLGLEPGPLGEAYLVKYGRNVTFIPGYRGLVKLAWQSGQLESLAAHVVYDTDEFEFSFGLAPTLVHKPALRGQRGNPIAAYAVAIFKGGGNAFEVMSVADVEHVRQSSRAGNSGPWKDHWSEMAKKTVIRRLAKMLPLSPELATAIAQDGQVRTDHSVEAIDTTPDFIEGETVDAPPEAAAAALPASEDPPAEVVRDSMRQQASTEHHPFAPAEPPDHAYCVECGETSDTQVHKP